MKLSEDGLKFVASFEGYHKALPDGRCQAYRCIIGRDKNGRPIHDGKWTIGFGCTEGITEGLIWTREEAERAFRDELAIFEAAVNRLVKVPISQNAFDALVSFAYNCGEGALSKSSLLKKLNKGDHAGASREFPNWNKSRGIVVSGLVRRRAAEAAMFLRPDKPASVTQAASVPDMPQSVEAPAPVKTALKKSRNIFAGLSTITALVAGLFKDAIAVAVEAAKQMEVMAPATKVAEALGITTERILFALAIAAIAAAVLGIYGRINDAATGATVK